MHQIHPFKPQDWTAMESGLLEIDLSTLYLERLDLLSNVDILLMWRSSATSCSTDHTTDG